MGTKKEPDLAPSKPSSPKARDRQPTRRPWRNNSEKNCLLPGGKWCDGDGSWAMDTLLFSYAYDLLLNWKMGSDTGWRPSTQVAIFTIQKILVGSFADGILICTLEAKILGCGIGEGLIVSRCWLDGGSNFSCWCLFQSWLPYKPNMAPSDGTRPRHPHPAMASKHVTTSAAKDATHMPHTIGRKNPYSYCYLWLIRLGWSGLKRPSLVWLVAFGIFSFLMLEVNWEYSVLDLAHWRVLCSSNLPFLLNIWWCLPQDSRSGAAAGDGESMDEDEKADSFNLRASLGWTNCDMEVI